jgi:hypothetical protein
VISAHKRIFFVVASTPDQTLETERQEQFKEMTPRLHFDDRAALFKLQLSYD